MKSTKRKYQHQHDLNGCGIACLSNLFNKDYQQVRTEFEEKFYKITRGVKVSDLKKFINLKGYNYSIKFFNRNNYNQSQSMEFAEILNSITLIRNENYPLGHYLLKVSDGWIDPWLNYPSIDNVHAGLRKELPGEPWYVVYPI